jgi:hypothetical protein
VQDLLEEYVPQEYPLLHDQKFERMGDINPTVFGDGTEEDATIVAEEEEQSQDNINTPTRRSSGGRSRRQQQQMYSSGQPSRKSSRQRQPGAGVIPTRSVSFARSSLDPDSDNMVEIELTEFSDGEKGSARKRSSVSSQGSIDGEPPEQDIDVHVVAEDEWTDEKLEDDASFASEENNSATRGGQIEGQATSPLGTRLMENERKRSAGAAEANHAARKPSGVSILSTSNAGTKQRFRITPLSPVETTREHRRNLRRLRRERILYGVKVLRRLRLKKMITRTKATAYDFQGERPQGPPDEGNEVAVDTEDDMSIRMSLDERTCH